MFNILTKERIAKIEVEATSYCNAGCPFCARHKYGTSIVDDYTQAHIDPNVMYKLKDDFGKQTKDMRVWFVGNLGDAIMHPKIENIWDFVATHFKGTELETNGGVRSIDFWKNMGNISKTKGDDQAQISFAIDGLEDTNEIYRKKVKWDRLMENVEAYLNAGGSAIWKMLVFDHNEHQVDEARALSKKLGFEQFIPLITTRNNVKAVSAFPNTLGKNEVKNITAPAEGNEANKTKEKLKPYSKLAKQDVDKIIDKRLEELAFHTSEPKIDCKYIKQKRMYLNSKGRIWPCCWHSEWYDKYDDLRRMDPLVKQGYIEGFNDYNNYSLDEIFASPIWKDMTDSWEKFDGMRLCQQKCVNKKWEILCNIKEKDIRSSM